MNDKELGVGESEEWLRQNYDRTDWLWGLALLGMAIALFTINLGGLPLRDWDEGLVAQVAREIWRSPPLSLTWIYPTLWEQPYTNKPPLMHWLIAIAYEQGGVNEWMARLPGALLAACSVPLLYGIGRETFHRRTPALFAALIYLTTLPIVRHGRLAMLDGGILCFLLLMMWSTLCARRDRRYVLGIGIGLGLICLTKGVMVGVLLGAIAFLFLLWDTPRLLVMPYLWLGIILGCIPVAFWYLAQYFPYGTSFFDQNLMNQSLRRIWTPVENNTGPPWYYLLELLKYGIPWLLLLPLGLKLTWDNRNLSWAKLALVWSGSYLLAISLMATKLPWYVLPVYPALAMMQGAAAATLWRRGKQVGIKYSPSPSYSWLWALGFAVLAIAGWAGFFQFSGIWTPAPDFDLMLTCAAVGFTMTVVTVLILRQNSQFLAVLIWGTYLSLMLLMLSGHWVWELAEAYPVQPVAAMVQQHTPRRQPIYTSYPYNRPSLNFYSDRRIVPASRNQLKQRWNQQDRLYLLLDEPTLEALDLSSPQLLGEAEGWVLLTKNE